MPFLGFDLGGPTPDEKTIRLYRDKLNGSGALKRVMKACDRPLRKKGYIPMAGQIVDASLVPAPKRRNTDWEKEAIKAGKSATEIWPDEPNKATQMGSHEGRRQGPGPAGPRTAASDSGGGPPLQKPHRHRPVARQSMPSINERGERGHPRKRRQVGLKC